MDKVSAAGIGGAITHYIALDNTKDNIFWCSQSSSCSSRIWFLFFAWRGAPKMDPIRTSVDDIGGLSEYVRALHEAMKRSKILDMAKTWLDMLGLWV